MHTQSVSLFPHHLNENVRSLNVTCKPIVITPFRLASCCVALSTIRIDEV